MSIEVNGMNLETDNEGLLLDPADRSEEAAFALANTVKVNMSDERWTVVNCIRNDYDDRQTVPEARHALKALKEKLGKEKATRKFLYSLFPYGYGQQACKITGMRKPLKLMLDI